MNSYIEALRNASVSTVLGLALCFITVDRAVADLTVSLDSISPSLSPRDGSIPPQPGVTLFVFPPSSIGDTYTAVFNVNEEPAATVGLAVEISDYSYDSNAGKVSVTFRHTGYSSGTTPPGPETDFSIAFIEAVGLGEQGPPEALKGSWMSTNIGPSDWEIIPPSQTSPSFGYKLSGGDGSSATFRMFIPQNFITFMSTVLGENLDVEDLAMFNGNLQASTSITQQSDELGNPIGALVDISVQFSNTQTEFQDVSTALFANASLRAEGDIEKSVTVGRAQKVSLAPSATTVKKGANLKLYGWVRDGVPGKKIFLMATPTLPKGKNVVAPYFKVVKLDSDSKFSATLKIKTPAKYTFRADYQSSKSKFVKSSKVKVKVTK